MTVLADIETLSEEMLTAPTLPALLACRGELPAIAILAGASTDWTVSQLDADELYALAEWALLAFSDGNEAHSLATVCFTFGTMPSAYIGLTDPVLAYSFDLACHKTLCRKDEAPNDPAEGGIRFTTGDSDG